MNPKITYSKTDPARVSYVEQKDIYKRKIGFTGPGVYKTFYLGGNEIEARARASRLDELWTSIVEANFYTPSQALWSEETLPMGHAIAEGQTTYIVPRPWHWDKSPQNYLDLIAEYVKGKYRGINFVAEDAATLEAGKQEVLEKIEHHRKEIVRHNDLLVTPIRTTAKTSAYRLHQAVELYAATIRTQYIEKRDNIGETKTSPWGMTFSASVERLKDAYPDCTLDLFDLASIEQIIRYWKARPYRKGSSKRIAVVTVDDQLSSLKRFVKWLHKEKKLGWRKPEDYDDDIFRTRRHDLLTVEEKAKPKKIPIWTIDELATIWKYATTWERVFILCGCNLGFASAEILSIRQNEIHFGEDKIKRIRIKTGIYGEFALWPETAAALKWVLSQSFVATDGIVLPDRTYHTTMRMWNRLINRIRKDDRNFRKLPFKFLRKTAGQMVQDVSDGETMAVFHCRGKRIDDEQADVYTNRDFAKVFAANLKVRMKLDKVFEVVEKFEGARRLGGSNISIGIIQKIKQLWEQGMKQNAIAAQVGVGRATVYRHRPKVISE